MPDYKEMYQALFRSMTKTITIMQQAQQATEEMYISLNRPISEFWTQFRRKMISRTMNNR